MKKGIFNQAIDFIVRFFKHEESFEMIDIKKIQPVEVESQTSIPVNVTEIDITKLDLPKEKIKELEKRIEELKSKNVINHLIPADDLHWNDYDKKYCAISDNDTDKIILTCHQIGASEEVMQALVKEFTQYRTAELLFKHFFEGNIGVYKLKNGKPFYEKIKK